MAIYERHDCEFLAVLVPGPPGQAGSGSGVADFVHTQPTPASQWVITHNLGRLLVDVVVYDLGVTTQYGGVHVEPLSANQVRLSMTPPLAGVARIF